MADRTYTKAEVDAILARALEREHARDGLTHQELVETAREIGVGSEAIERAASEVMSERREREELQTAGGNDAAGCGTISARQ